MIRHATNKLQDPATRFPHGAQPNHGKVVDSASHSGSLGRRAY